MGRPSNKQVHARNMKEALNFCKPFGFPQKTVREIIQDLLTAYDGLQGWSFIKANNYQDLIDLVLDKINKDQQQDAVAGPSSQQILQQAEEPSQDVLTGALPTAPAEEPKLDVPIDKRIITDDNTAQAENISTGLHDSLPAADDMDVEPSQAENVASPILIQQSEIPPEPQQPRQLQEPQQPQQQPQLQPEQPVRTRPPSHGWFVVIESEPESESDVEELPTLARMKKPSRFDIQPICLLSDYPSEDEFLM